MSTPQVYSYVNTDGQADIALTRGEVEILHVNWEKLDGDYFGDYEAVDFLADWRELGKIADHNLRNHERREYLALFREHAQAARDDRRWETERETRQRTRELEAARALLRQAGELP